MDGSNGLRLPGITNICQVVDLVVHFFAAGGDAEADGVNDEDDDMFEPAEEAPPAAAGNAPEASSPGGTGDPAEEGEPSRGTPTGGTGDGGTGDFRDTAPMTPISTPRDPPGDHRWEEWDQTSQDTAIVHHRSSEWDQMSQNAAIVPSTGTNEAHAGDSSPDESPNLTHVIDNGVDTDGSWATWNQFRNQRGKRGSLDAPTHDHRDRGGDHRTHDARAGNWGTDHREHREDSAASSRVESHGHGADDWASRQDIVTRRRREAFSALENRAEWRTFAMDLDVWDWTLWKLGVDEGALRKLKVLAEVKVGELALGYMMANGIVGKVLDKVSKVEAFEGGTPNRFIMGCVKKAMLKLDHKRKAIEDAREDTPQTSGAASSFDHRPQKGGKYR